MKKITIAIDGTSSTGKSTLAKLIAKELGYVYVDTGAMYRTVALFAMRNNLVSGDTVNKEELITKLDQIKTSFVYNPDLGFSEAYLNGENVEKEIRTLEVSNYVSKVASISEVRQKLVEIQQEMGVNKGVVMDGRDIGTVVFPNAEVKLFVTASAEIRAKRRFLELEEKGTPENFDDVLKNIQERDDLDINRKDSPLVAAADAITIDNSNMTREENFSEAMRIINEKIQA